MFLINVIRGHIYRSSSSIDNLVLPIRIALIEGCC